MLDRDDEALAAIDSTIARAIDPSDIESLLEYKAELIKLNGSGAVETEPSPDNPKE
ncbi:hypothetical protein KKC97_01390 [bacterium]|nr:hypothetical protein [bacterium]MBU1636304.1 hypothetical protein [bacterium]